MLARLRPFLARVLRAMRRGRRIAIAVVAAPFVLLALLALARSGLEAPAPTLLVTDRAGRFLGELPAPGDERLGFWKVDKS